MRRRKEELRAGGVSRGHPPIRNISKESDIKLPKGRPMVAPMEARAQLLTVEQHLLAGASEWVITKVMRERHQVGIRRTQTLMARVRETWAREDATARMSWKSAAIRRIHGHIQKASGRRDPENPSEWIDKPDHPSLARYENLLAEIQGTKDPIKIDLEVRVSEAVLHCITTMTPEDVALQIEEAREARVLAERYRQIAPQLPPSLAKAG